MDSVEGQEAAAAGSGKEPEKTKGGKGGKGGKGRKAKRKREDEEDDGTPVSWEEQSEEDGDGDGEPDAVPETIKNYVKTVLGEHQTVKAQVEQLKAANKLLEDKVRDFKNADEHKKLGYDVDLATLKKKVAQLPPDGDITGFLFDTSCNIHSLLCQFVCYIPVSYIINSLHTSFNTWMRVHVKLFL